MILKTLASDDESIDVTNIQPNVQFLPATVEGLRKRFHELYIEFTRQGKHKHRGELVFLLDELLRYTIVNNILTKSLGSGIAGEEQDDDKESANVEDDSVVEEDKAGVEDKSPDEMIKMLIQST